jgi:hypothetical protein
MLPPVVMPGLLALSGEDAAIIALAVVVGGYVLTMATLVLMSPFWTPDQSVRNQIWIGVNIAATLVLFGLLNLYDVGLYLWFVRNLYGVVVFIVALPVLIALTVRAFESKRNHVATIWLAFAAIILLGVGRSAINDAHKFRYDNCWRVRPPGAYGEGWACAPGTKPHEVISENATRVCDRIRSDETGDTLWSCFQTAV